MNLLHFKKQQQVMHGEVQCKEYDALIKNGTWRLVDPPISAKPIGWKWVYKNKYKVDGSLDKQKARLVAKRYSQREGVDYTKKNSPTAKWWTIWALFSLAAQKGWHIHHMDIKTAFLNGDLKEDVYMLQPQGFVIKGQEHNICNLIKYLDGLKQAPHAFYEKLTKHLIKLDYKHFSLDDATLFVKKIGWSIVYLVVYVDYLLIIGNNDDYIESIKRELKKCFDMTDLELLHYYHIVKERKYHFTLFNTHVKTMNYLTVEKIFNVIMHTNKK